MWENINWEILLPLVIFVVASGVLAARELSR
jgi:hypothetical protein